MQALTIEQPFVSRLAGRHSAWMSIILHLLPGLLAGAIYYLLAQPVARLGLPSIVSLIAAGVLALIPFELGVILLAAMKGGPKPLSFKEMIDYREQIPIWHYIALVPALFLVTGLLFTLLKPVSNFMQTGFSWLPASMVLSLGNDGNYAQSTLIWVTALNLLLIVIVIPVIEELYFRGFLLPRMPEGLKGFAPLANSFLFAAYHVWSPWMLVVRALGLLPMIYIVKREKNIYLGIMVHCLANLVDVITMIVFIAGMQ